jgi:iron complex transport system ATP-binding protein
MTSLAEARGVAIGGRLASTDLSIKPGRMIAVIGPNGGGKTSLLRALARTEDSNGEVIIEGVDLGRAAEAQRRKLVAFLPASRDAAWPVTVVDYLALGLGAPRPERIAELIGALELGPLAERPIDRLSTGERARAMLGRALAGKARLLLLDEPLSNLDPYWVVRTLDVLRSEISANVSSALVSVHDLSLLPRFDRALLVDGGQIVADDQPQAMIERLEFGNAFRIARSGAGWAIKPLADPRSSR